MMLNKNAIIIIIVLIIVAVMYWVDPIPQDLNYHLFADITTLWGVNNFWNVASNLPFIIFGAMGVWTLLKNLLQIESSTRIYYWVFFIGIIGVGFGSAWYHLNPNNETLVWDRLPMTIAFMAFFSVILFEHVDKKLGKIVFWPLIAIGLFSIIYWQYTESVGAGDLRMYALVQFLPLVMMPFIFIFVPKPYSHSHFLWVFLGCYVVAKLLEHFDAQVFETISIISGHSLKHIAAALGVYFYWRYLLKRNKLN